MEIPDSELFTNTTAVRDKAYAPYSNFKVGATLVAEDGSRFEGCNVENRSFGLTMCAERVVVGSAIAAGKNRFKLLTIVTDSVEPVVPCGACRQVLAEFSPNLKIISRTLKGQTLEFDLSALLPLPHQGILG
jgi:cytidine deaminase